MSLDVMRVFSLLLIITYHVFMHFKMKGLPLPASTLFLPMGAVGVSFFIIISGCALGFSWGNKKENVYGFYRKRLLSILPYFWVAYIVVAAVYFLYQGRLDFKNDLSPLIWSLIGMDGYLMQTTKTYYLVGEWFTGFILLMYLIYPLVYKLLVRFPLSTVIIISTIAVLTYDFNKYIAGLTWFWNPNPQWNPIARLPELIFGMLFVNFLQANRDKKYMVLTCVLIMVIYGFFDIGFKQGIYSTPLLISLFVVLCLFFNFLNITGGAKEFLSNLSKYSFMVFLFHHQVIYLSFNILGMQKVAGLGFITYLSMVVVVSFILAIVFYPLGHAISNYLNNILNNLRTNKIPR
ncbi:acyltransferase [Escherichia coli]|uniref:acyltransferase family protein n=1 Tax=Escherichia coli TaxID=562 RepID=UPI002FF3B1E2